MENSKIAFVGGGNMAFSLIGGLIAGNCSGSSIHVSDPSHEALGTMAQQYGVQTFPEDNGGAIEGVDAIVLAVKPQMLAEVATEIAPVVQAQSPPPL
ncbi:MAG TPA: NAD(P)-binding domain-containing protein, partial [Gammaproteobacteria bacterium]|nr:NAD(P)-binding domain-containing protein [Gammaproteobacteria bacterium]